MALPSLVLVLTGQRETSDNLLGAFAKSFLNREYDVLDTIEHKFLPFLVVKRMRSSTNHVSGLTLLSAIEKVEQRQMDIKQ